MKRIVMIMVVLLAGAVFVKVAGADEAADLFAKANEFYKADKYDEAIREYEEILQKGFENGTVYYNLGNSYFKKRDLGLAVLNYERARRLIPRDGDLQSNEHYALSFVAGSITAPVAGLWDRMWQQHAAFYTVDEMTSILVILFVLIALVHLTGLYGRWPRPRALGVIAVVSVIFVLQLTGLWYKWDLQRDAAVVVKASPARFEPKTEATVYFDLSEGQTLTVVQELGEWVKIQRPDGKAGWVMGESISKI